MRPPLYPPGDSVGGSRVVTPDSPFSVEDMTSDSIFYVQDGQRKAQASQDVFSLYISNGHSQTEAFSVEIDIQVGNVKQPPWLIYFLVYFSSRAASMQDGNIFSLWECHIHPCSPLCRVKKTGSPWCPSAASTWRKTPESSSPTPRSESSATTLQTTRSSSRSSGSPPTVRTSAYAGEK